MFKTPRKRIRFKACELANHYGMHRDTAALYMSEHDHKTVSGAIDLIIRLEERKRKKENRKNGG